jgi:hypothetical protein
MKEIQRIAVTNGYSTFYFVVGEEVHANSDRYRGWIIESIYEFWDTTPRMSPDQGVQSNYLRGYMVYAKGTVMFQVPPHSVVYVEYED